MRQLYFRHILYIYIYILVVNSHVALASRHLLQY